MAGQPTASCYSIEMFDSMETVGMATPLTSTRMECLCTALNWPVAAMLRQLLWNRARQWVLFRRGRLDLETSYVLTAPDGTELLNEVNYGNGDLMTSAVTSVEIVDCDDTDAAAIGAAASDHWRIVCSTWMATDMGMPLQGSYRRRL